MGESWKRDGDLVYPPDVLENKWYKTFLLKIIAINWLLPLESPLINYLSDFNHLPAFFFQTDNWTIFEFLQWNSTKLSNVLSLKKVDYVSENTIRSFHKHGLSSFERHCSNSFSMIRFKCYGHQLIGVSYVNDKFITISRTKLEFIIVSFNMRFLLSRNSTQDLGLTFPMMVMVGKWNLWGWPYLLIDSHIWKRRHAVYPDLIQGMCVGEPKSWRSQFLWTTVLDRALRFTRVLFAVLFTFFFQLCSFVNYWIHSAVSHLFITRFIVLLIACIQINSLMIHFIKCLPV